MSGSLTERQMKAIALYARRNNATPQLSAPPSIRFKLPDGTIKEVDMIRLLAVYDESKRKKSNEHV